MVATGHMSPFVMSFITVVPDEELDIDALDGFTKGMRGLHPKPEGEDPECFCGDVCKMEVSGDYKTLWQRFWMCNNLAYDPEPGDTEVPYEFYYKHLQQVYLLISLQKIIISLLVFCSLFPPCVTTRFGLTM